MDHSYEEIRAAAIDVISGRVQLPWPQNQYGTLSAGVAEVFAQHENPGRTTNRLHPTVQLSASDSELFLEVFWDLFRQGIITLGYDNSNRDFPFYRASRLGKQILQNQDTSYFVHDVSTYSKWLKTEVPAVNDVTLLYLQEALQAFRSGCILSSTVMLGVATEHHSIC